MKLPGRQGNYTPLTARLLGGLPGIRSQEPTSAARPASNPTTGKGQRVLGFDRFRKVKTHGRIRLRVRIAAVIEGSRLPVQAVNNIFAELRRWQQFGVKIDRQFLRIIREPRV